MKSLATLSIIMPALLAVFVANAADDAPAWPLACRTASYGKYEAAALSHMSSIGLNYVFIPVPAADQVEATIQKLKDAKLTPLVVRGNTDLSKEACVDELGAQAAICGKMGVKYMFLSAKCNGAEKSVVYERLRRAGDAAQKHGVIISLETHPELCTNGDVQLETMKAINHPNVRINFDTANITFYNKDTTAVAELKKIIDYVATVEIKDHNAEFESWNFPALGTGKVDFPAIFKILKEHQYAGPVTIEFEGVKGVELTEEQTKQAIADSVAYVKSIAAFK
ncbi:MAG TPA: sugar phosphate isomerase/epimerase family protein [Candidatus Hydrogenedentes bacterium]|nr:sugar phosphate isomerase/epimerase family protein [Candidatus Hydrogenedentota bacterium]HRT21491.1 sugar phosphate isomerase/epimerase family protein [Candidatus Hydrogenedentota bacterium]HRT66195.1 sugar phosphate isomerase/epimerase family protein [Candidatus Hydrogenedentota bacterium]